MALPHCGKGGGKARAAKRPNRGTRDSPSGDESGERSDQENMLWTKDTDLVLRDLVLRSGEIVWAKIATAIEWDAGTVTARECEDRSVFCFYFCSRTHRYQMPFCNQIPGVFFLFSLFLLFSASILAVCVNL